MRIFTLAVLLACTGCSASRVDDIKANAPNFLRAQGFQVVGYQGYQWGTFGQWGGMVWYQVERTNANGILYELCVTKWGNEYHMYSLRAIDAISPRD